MDYFDEIAERDEWLRGGSDEGLTSQELLLIIKMGLRRCSGDCLSRQACGDDSCRCVRSLFPSPDYYEVYEAARKFFEKELSKAAFSAFVSESMNRRKNEK